MATKQATKKAPAKKTTSKSVATKKSAATRKVATAKKPEGMKSFRVYKSDVPFTSLKPTRQTFYWIIIIGLITVAQLLILKIQLDIMELTQPIYM